MSAVRALQAVTVEWYGTFIEIRPRSHPELCGNEYLFLKEKTIFDSI